MSATDRANSTTAYTQYEHDTSTISTRGAVPRGGPPVVSNSLPARVPQQHKTSNGSEFDATEAEPEDCIELTADRLLPPEILAIVFADLATMEPLGDIEVTSSCDSHTSWGSDLYSDWSYDPDATQHDTETLGVFLNSTFDPEKAIDPLSEGSQADNASTLSLYPYSLGWTRVAHVCAYWRNLAISMAQLWCTVPFHLSAPWIQAIISRSRQLPLDIIFEEDVAMDETRESLMLECFTRTRSVDFRHGSPILLFLVMEVVKSSQDVLEDLSIAVLNYSFIGANITLFGSLDLAQYRALTCITIEHSDKFPRAGPPGLKHFSLTSCSERPTSSGLLSFLRTLTHIETLELRHCLPTQVEVFHPSSHDRVVLDTLQALTLEEHRSNLWGNLIHHLHYPASTRISISYLRQTLPDLDLYFGGEPSSGGHRPFQHFALNRILSPDLDDHTPPIQTLSISSIGGGTLTRMTVFIYGWRQIPTMVDGRADYYVRSAPVSARPDVYFELHDTDSRQTRPVHQKIIRTLIGAVKLEHIRVLSLDLEEILAIRESDTIERWSPDTWIVLFSSANRVEHVRVTSSAEESAAVDLLLALGGMVEGSTTFSMFPTLQTIEMCDTIPVSKDSGGEVHAMDALHALLLARRANRGSADANCPFRVYLVLQHEPLSDIDARDLVKSGLPVSWEDVGWVIDDEDVILEDMRVTYETYE
ncbi:unnamed protein product [Peniophora sp. CBMAI 1063]|nr:unnamed protein product [Peniophora sp. CBMAI 1063]